MPVAAEDCQAPISVTFDYAVLLRGGQAVRLARIQVKPSQVDDVIGVAGDQVVPSLCEAPGFRAALLFAGPASGQMISETIRRDPRARTAAPAGAAAIIRREFPDEAGSAIPDSLMAAAARSAASRTTPSCSALSGTPDSALTQRRHASTQAAR